MKINTTNPKEVFFYTQNEDSGAFEKSDDDIRNLIELNRYLVTCPEVIKKLDKAIYSEGEDSLVYLLKKYDIGKNIGIYYSGSLMGVIVPKIDYKNMSKEELLNSYAIEVAREKEVVFANIVIQAFLSDFVLENYIKLICFYQKQFVGVEDTSYNPDIDDGTKIPLALKMREEDEGLLLNAIYTRKDSFFSMFQAFNRESIESPYLKIVFEEKYSKILKRKTGFPSLDSYCGYNNAIEPSDNSFDNIVYNVLPESDIKSLKDKMRLFDKGSLVRSFNNSDDFVENLYKVLYEMGILFITSAGSICIENKIVCIEDILKDIFTSKDSSFRGNYSFFYHYSDYSDDVTFTGVENKTMKEEFYVNIFDVYCNPNAVKKSIEFGTIA